MTDTIPNLESLLAKATPGEWESKRKDISWGVCIEPNIAWLGDGRPEPQVQNDDNAALIVAMKNNLPALLRVAKAAKEWRSATCDEADCASNELRRAVYELEKTT